MGDLRNKWAKDGLNELQILVHRYGNRRVFPLWMAKAGRNSIGSPILDCERKSVFSLELWYCTSGRAIATDSSGEKNEHRKAFYVSDLRINCLLHGIVRDGAE